MRHRLIFFCFLLSFSAVAFRLFTIQILRNDEYTIAAEKQRAVSSSIPAERGKIFFSSGESLATNEDAYLVFADPQKIENSGSVARSIAPILLGDNRFLSYNQFPGNLTSLQDAFAPLKDRLNDLLSQKSQQWVSLAKKVPAEIVSKLKNLRIPGLGFEQESRRFYPEGTLASSVLGLVASDADGSDHGYNGLEGYYDGDLRGKDGTSIQEYSATGDPILVGSSSLSPPQNGSDLYLTIDRTIQGILENKIKEGVERYQADSGSFVVLEPQTGKVLAIGSYPNFDPGNFNPPSSSQSTPIDLRDLAISDIYEPGSVMKAVTLSAALDSGKIDPSWTFDDNGPLHVSGATINTWDGRHWGKQNLAELLQKSNNVGAAQVALATGAETLRSYFLNFGFGKRLGIDLEGEEAGLVKEQKEWRPVDLANAGFGQGVGVTALQMADAYAAIANGGVLMKPYVVEKIVDPNGRGVKFSPTPIKRVISPKTSELMVELLRAAAEGGESIILRKYHYSVAGKTGTAQIPVGGRYDPNKTNVTFVGFFIKGSPFVMLIELSEPKTSTFSATTVVPLWIEAASELAPLFGILPDR